MNNNPYMNPYINYNQQPINYNQPINTPQTSNYDEYIKFLDKEKERVEKSKEQYLNKFQQPTAINQTFQISPTGNAGMKFATSIDEVAKEVVFYDTPFFSKDLSVVWLKNAKGDIKAYEMNEIIEKDEKDMQIELLQAEQKEKEDTINSLQAQIDELKGMINNEQFNSNVDTKQISTNTSTNDETVGGTVKKNKSTSLSRISTSKKE